MDGPNVLIVTGPPGAGKTTVARLMAGRFPLSVCLEADWFWTTVVNGFVLPWEPASRHQNEVMIRALASAAARMASGGYAVVVDGIVGPWFLDIATEELRSAAVPVDYVVLRPDLQTCLERATGRTGEERVAGHPALIDEGPIRHMWHQFTDLGAHEHHALDTTDLAPDATVELIYQHLLTGGHRLVSDSSLEADGPDHGR